MGEPNDKDAPAEQPRKKFGLLQLTLSILAGAIGVQSNKNRERDFQEGGIRKFVIGGLIFTALFVLTLMLIVNIALSN